MKIKKFFEEAEESYLDELKKSSEEHTLAKSMEGKAKELFVRVDNALDSSKKTKDKLFLQELESLLDKHGF